MKRCCCFTQTSLDEEAADLETALDYFEHNAHRMRYARFRKLGMFANSGVIEAATKRSSASG